MHEMCVKYTSSLWASSENRKSLKVPDTFSSVYRKLSECVNTCQNCWELLRTYILPNYKL